MTNRQTLVIIGSGIAGISAAFAARQKYSHIRIRIISAEKDSFYNRIALGALVCQKRTEAELFTMAPHLLEDNRIETINGKTAIRINNDTKTVLLDDKAEVPFDRLILAQGATSSKPVIPGIDNPNVHFLWTLNDARKLKDAVQATASIAVIGGGVLGIEAAMDFAKLGKKVHIIEAQKSLLGHIVPPSVGNQIKRQLGSLGIQIHLGSNIHEIKPYSEGSIIVTNEGSIHCDRVLISAGITPQTQLAKQTGCAVDNGISVNSYMETTIPGILACGNCVCPAQGQSLLWNPAKEQGEIAGVNAFNAQVSFAQKRYPIHLKSDWLFLFAIGNLSQIQKDTRCISRTHTDNSIQQHIYINSNGHLVYAVLLGSIDGYHELEKWFQNPSSLVESVHPDASIESIITALRPKVNSTHHQPKTSWVCSICGYTHENEHAPGICPVCSVGRDQFLAA